MRAARSSCCSAAIRRRRLPPAACSRNWLPGSPWQAAGHNVLGIVAPTVEAATQTPWAVTTPQYPQKYLTDRIAVFGTTRTISSNVYFEEIKKRCPKAEVIQQVCSELAGAIEAEASAAELERLVKEGIDGAMAQAGGEPPHRAILGCTHFPARRASLPQAPAARDAHPVPARRRRRQPRGLSRAPSALHASGRAAGAHAADDRRSRSGERARARLLAGWARLREGLMPSAPHASKTPMSSATLRRCSFASPLAIACSTQCAT